MLYLYWGILKVPFPIFLDLLEDWSEVQAEVTSQKAMEAIK